jgi:hypothetical protein
MSPAFSFHKSGIVFMKNHFLKAALFALALFGLALPAMAISNDQNRVFPPRDTHEQMSHFYRFTVNFNDPRIATGQQFGALPSNAYILAMDSQVTTAFNAGTTNVLTVGVTSASSNELIADGASATANISNNTTTIATGIRHLTTAAGLGVTITGNVTYQNGSGGGVPLFAKYTQTGTAATTGSVTIIIEYIPNIDQ